MGKFIDFSAVEQLATIEQLADMLGLKVKRSGRQLRCACPVHAGDERTLAITPDVKSRRGSEGVFFCQKAQSGGDRIGLVAHCMDIGQQDAAFFIAEQLGAEATVEGTDTSTVTVSNSRATVPPKKEKAGANSPAFDPDAYLAKLSYSDEVKELGISEDDAKILGIGTSSTGLHRGRIAIALRWPSGEIAGFASVEGGTVKLPKTLIPPKVVHLKRSA
jgi:hypothetical protein